MEPHIYDVLIIGAGAAGLMAAREIAESGKKVAILEARNRTGGRISTVKNGDYPIALGAEFVHGNLAITKSLLKKGGASLYPIEGSIWQF